MNVTPELIGRLKRLAASVAKTKNAPQTNGGTEKDEETNKKELETNGKENEENETNSASGGCTGTNGISNDETESELPTLKDKEAVKDSERTMDMDVFRQMLKELIVKRTIEAEKRVMGDVEALKKQVSVLEMQNKTLEKDSKRLVLNIQDFFTKYAKVKETPLSPQIPRQMREFSKSNEVNKVLPGSRLHYSDPEKVINREASVTTAHDTRTSLEQNDQHMRDGESAQRHSPELRIGAHSPLQRNTPQPPVRAEVSTVPHTHVQPPVRPTVQEPPVQGQFSSKTQSPTTQQQQQQQLNNEVQIVQHTQANNVPTSLYPTVKRGPPNVSLYPSNKRRRADAPPSTTGSLHVVASDSNYVMHNFKIKKTISAAISQRARLRASAPVSEPLRGNQQVFIRGASNQVPGTHVNQGHSNIQPAVNPTRSPPRTHFSQASPNFQPVRNPPGQVPGPQFNQGPTNVQTFVQAARNSPNQVPGSHLNQSPSNIQPAVYSEPNRVHANGRAPVNQLGHSQGQLVERVFYPSARPRQASTEYAPRVMQAQTQLQVQPPHPGGQPGTVYVVREYQVSQQQQQQQQQQLLQQPQQQQQRVPIQSSNVPLSHQATQFQQIAPASSAVPRTQPYPPVQSPGISSTASPLGRRVEPTAVQDQRGTANQPSSYVVRKDQPAPSDQLKTPPKPTASIVVVQDGIVLSWNMQLDETMAKIDNYELFACQDGAESTTPPIMWKKIGIVKALPLPMACTLSQFSSGNKYHFAVRAVDDQERAGPFSDPCTISLTT